MDEESSISNNSFNDQENDENFLDKENQSNEQNSDDDYEHNRYIYEQQQFQRSQFYQQNQQQQQPTYHNYEENSNQSIINENSPDEMDYEDTDRTPKSVPDYLIDKISNERWPGVNGYYSNNEWKEWHEVSMGFNTYTNEEIVILPYVPFVTNDTSISLDISC